MKYDDNFYRFLSLLLKNASSKVYYKIFGEFYIANFRYLNNINNKIFNYSYSMKGFLEFLINSYKMPAKARSILFDYLKFLSLSYYSYVDIYSDLYLEQIIEEQLDNLSNNGFFYYESCNKLVFVNFLKYSYSYVTDTFDLQYTPSSKKKVKLKDYKTGSSYDLPKGSVLFKKLSSERNSKSYSIVHNKIVDLYLKTLSKKPCIWCNPICTDNKIPVNPIRHKCENCTRMVNALNDYIKNNKIPLVNLNNIAKVESYEYHYISEFRQKKIERLLTYVSKNNFSNKREFYKYLNSDEEVCKIIRQYYPKFGLMKKS